MSVPTTKKLLRTSMLLLFTVVLAVVCMGIANFQSAHATTGSVTVALTIVDENDASMKNQTYTLDEGKTVADLLTAAGFHEGTQTESATSPSTCYYDSYGYPAFKGLEYDAGSGKYWASYYEGASAVSETALATTLVDAKHYQYYYTTFATTSFNYTTLGLTDPMPTTPDPKPAEVNTYDPKKTAELTETLAAKFSAFDIDGETYEAAMALNSLGMGNAVNAQSILESIVNEGEGLLTTANAGLLAKYILALTAGGVDCTNVTIEGKNYNLVKEMQDCLEGYDNFWGMPVIIAVYHYGSYQLSGTDKVIDTIIKDLLKAQTATGMLDGGWGDDIDLTAEAVNALLPYADRSDVATFLQAAKGALLDYLQETGAIDTFLWGEDYPDSTAKTICALVGLGVDVAHDNNLVTKNGSSPLGFMVNKVSKSANPDMGEGKVLLALAAAKNYKEGGYNVFDFTALPAPDENLPKAGDTTPMLPLTIIASLALLGMASGTYIKCKAAMR